MIQADSSAGDPRVAVVKVSPANYDDPGAIRSAMARAASLLDWHNGSGEPFGNVIAKGDRILIKPNLVTHANQGPWGMGPLITHPRHIFAAAEAALNSEPSEVLVGDAPVQGCDFDALVTNSGINSGCRKLQSQDERFKGILDFRRTTCEFVAGVRRPHEALRDLNRFVLFDLGQESLLEDITDQDPSFRVTCYDPDLLAKTHSRGTHQYLVAREVIDADLVINLPKLKTHKKAGVTCALKNLIGINGNKEYLPHHRIGGASAGGDCYPGTSLLKRSWEYALDRMNSAGSVASALVWRQTATQLSHAASIFGDRLGVEGSWSGNDTIWRTCLDLNRILLYGRSGGTLGDHPQRKVIHIADAVIAGQGDGPLKPQDLPLGLIIAGCNAAAVDLVGTQLLGYEPGKIPCVRNAFGNFRWPVATFEPSEVVLTGDFGNSM
ncbi:MAG TPA: DUF362 domain-containing protein, partial [Blastocatellia bacterium]